MLIEQALAATATATDPSSADPVYNYIHLIVSTLFSAQVMALAIVLLFLRKPDIVEKITNIDLFWS